MPCRRLRHRLRAEGVHPDRLAQVALEDGHLLVGRRVKHDLGAVALEDPLDGGFVADVGEDHRAGEPRMRGAQLELNPMKVELADVHDDEAGGLEAHNLATQLASDGAAPTGDEDSASGELAAHGGPVEHDRLAVQKVRDGHLPELAGRETAQDDVLQPGYRPDRDVRALAMLDNPPHLGRTRGRYRDGDDLRPGTRDDVRDAAAGSEDADAMNVSSPLLAGVVDEAHREVSAVRIAPQLAHEHLSHHARTDDERPSRVRRRPCPVA